MVEARLETGFTFLLNGEKEKEGRKEEDSKFIIDQPSSSSRGSISSNKSYEQRIIPPH